MDSCDSMMNLKKAFYGTYMYPATIIQRYIQIGTNVFEREWDVLIVLDACRVDAIDEVATEYEFIENRDSIWSVGSTSKEWYIHTFQERNVSNVTLVSGNAWIKDLFESEPDWKYWTATRNSMWHELSILDSALKRPLPSSEDFNSYLPVAGSHGGEVGTTPLPSDVTNAAIYEHRRQDPEKMIVHYMQPHEPYIQNESRGKLPEMHSQPFETLKAGQATREEVYSAYLNNLREVLDSVDKLLKNIDGGRVAITADHGELFGEWGAYTHPAAFPHPAVRKVPWITTEANNTEELDVEKPDEIQASVEDRLSDLGYI